MRTISTCRCGRPMTPGSSVCRECYWESVRAAASVQPPSLCSESGCQSVVRARSLCNRHYKEWHRASFAPKCVRCNENPVTTRGESGLCFPCYQQARGERRAVIGCSVQDCTDQHAAKGYCKRHYMALQKPRKTKYFDCIDCGVPCVNPDGRCRPCNDAFKRGRNRERCIRDGCERPHVARGLCKSHYESERTKGRPQRIWAGQVLRRTVRTMSCQACGYSDTVVDVHRLVPADGYTLGNVVAVCPNCHRKIHLAGAAPPPPITVADLDAFASETAKG